MCETHYSAPVLSQKGCHPNLSGHADLVAVFTGVQLVALSQKSKKKKRCRNEEATSPMCSLSRHLTTELVFVTANLMGDIPI